MRPRSPSFLRHIISSGAKSKTISRTELADIQDSINRLANRSRDFLETSVAVDSIGPQVEALRTGFTTLSQVAIDEIDTLRADMKALKSTVASQDKKLAVLSASNDGYTRTIKTLASEVEELRESNRRLKHELESQLSFTHTFESSVSAIKAQVTSLSGALAQCQQSSKSVADVSSTVTANSAAITEIIRDNQIIHEALIALTHNSKSLSSEMLTVKDAALSSASRVVMEGLTSDMIQSQRVIGALQQITAELESSVAHLLNKSDSTEISAATRIHALKSELEAKLAESSKACVAVKHDIESLASQTQTQHDRLKACFDECIKSIGTCNASITAQCSATESSSTATLSQLKKQVKDTEVATQRQIDALTHAVHALAGVLHITPMSSK